MRWTAALMLMVLLGPGDVRARPPSDPSGIHARESAAARGAVQAVRTPPLRPAPLAPRSDPLAAEVLGFFPYWRQDLHRALDWSLLTTVAWFSVELDGRGEVAAANGWPHAWAELVDTAHRHGVGVLLTASLFDEAALDSLLGDPHRRAATAARLTDLAAAGGADGVMVDFESVPGERREDLTAFLQELRAALDASQPASRLAATIPPEDWRGAYDAPALAAVCDRLVVMAYDYTDPGSPVTGPVAPLTGRGTLSVTRSLDILQAQGVPADALLLGVPYYGYEWEAASAEAGAATIARGVTRRYEEAAAAARIHGTHWHAPSGSPWLLYGAPQWRQLWFDDAASLAAKYALVRSRGLAGVSIWALSYDGPHPELWDALAAAFTPGGGPAPRDASLSHAGASPFRGVAHVRWSLPAADTARLVVYDVRGRRVQTLYHGSAAAGGVALWNGRGARGGEVPAGVYLVRLETPDRTAALRLVKLP